MDPNRLADARHSAEQMLVLSVVFLVAAAMLIVSHWLSTRRRAHAAARVEPTALERTAVERTAAEAAVIATTASATAPERA
jgi:hypothetical protein